MNGRKRCEDLGEAQPSKQEKVAKKTSKKTPETALDGPASGFVVSSASSSDEIASDITRSVVDPASVCSKGSGSAGSEVRNVRFSSSTPPQPACNKTTKATHSTLTGTKEEEKLDLMARSVTESVRRTDELLQNHRSQIELFQKQWDQREQEFQEREERLKLRLVSERTKVTTVNRKLQAIEQKLESEPPMPQSPVSCMPTRRWKSITRLKCKGGKAYTAVSGEVDSLSSSISRSDSASRDENSEIGSLVLSGTVHQRLSKSKWKSRHIIVFTYKAFLQLRVISPEEADCNPVVINLWPDRSSLELCRHHKYSHCLRIHTDSDGSVSTSSNSLVFAVSSKEEVKRWIHGLKGAIAKPKRVSESVITTTTTASSSSNSFPISEIAGQNLISI